MRPKRELIRLVRRADGVVVADPGGPGRGAYVCAEDGCLVKALRAGRLAQVFRKPCEVASGFVEEVRGLWQRQRSK